MPKFYTDEEMMALESQQPKKSFISDEEMLTMEGEKPSQLESALRGAAQGATFNFSDELEAAVSTGANLLTGKVNPSVEDVKAAYYGQKEEAERKNEEAKAANPGTYGLAQVGSSIASPLNKLGVVASGIAMGVGASEDPIEGGLLGGTLGALGGAAGGALGSIAPTLASAASKQLPQAIKGAGIGLGSAIGGPIGGYAGYKAAKQLTPKVIPTIRSGIDKVSEILQSNPNALGRFLPALQSAMQRGKESLNSTLFILKQREPEFRQLMEDGDE